MFLSYCLLEIEVRFFSGLDDVAVDRVLGYFLRWFMSAGGGANR
jgi:hypothetical protein